MVKPILKIVLTTSTPNFTTVEMMVARTRTIIPGRVVRTLMNVVTKSFAPWKIAFGMVMRKVLMNRPTTNPRTFATWAGKFNKNRATEPPILPNRPGRLPKNRPMAPRPSAIPPPTPFAMFTAKSLAVEPRSAKNPATAPAADPIAPAICPGRFLTKLRTSPATLLAFSGSRLSQSTKLPSQPVIDL